jgi:hypothetical protein
VAEPVARPRDGEALSLPVAVLAASTDGAAAAGADSANAGWPVVVVTGALDCAGAEDPLLDRDPARELDCSEPPLERDSDRAGVLSLRDDCGEPAALLATLGSSNDGDDDSVAPPDDEPDDDDGVAAAGAEDCCGATTRNDAGAMPPVGRFAFTTYEPGWLGAVAVRAKVPPLSAVAVPDTAPTIVIDDPRGK